MKNAIGYIRVSTDEQVEHGYGADAQIKQIQEYADKNDYNVIEWVKDLGESGNDDSTPKLLEIVYSDEVLNPPYEVVLAAKSDRISRKIENYYFYKYMLKKKNIEVVSVSEDFGAFGAFSSVLESFIITMAQMERDNITARTTSGRIQKASLGGYSGGNTPYGYRAQAGELVIVPEEAEAVRLMFKLRDEEGKSYRVIADELNDKGYKTKQGMSFLYSSVQRIVRNRKTYEGWYKYGDSEWVMGQHDPILHVAEEARQ